MVITRVTSGGSGFFIAGWRVLGCVPQANSIYPVSVMLETYNQLSNFKVQYNNKRWHGVTETLTVAITLSSKHDKNK